MRSIAHFSNLCSTQVISSPFIGGPNTATAPSAANVEPPGRWRTPPQAIRTAAAMAARRACRGAQQGVRASLVLASSKGACKVPTRVLPIWLRVLAHHVFLCAQHHQTITHRSLLSLPPHCWPVAGTVGSTVWNSRTLGLVECITAPALMCSRHACRPRMTERCCCWRLRMTGICASADEPPAWDGAGAARRCMLLMQLQARAYVDDRHASVCCMGPV